MREGAIISDKYRILRKIGEGGMGSVWLARNEVTEREFAIKFMSAEFAHSEPLLARFLQEARVAGRLRHPSLLEIFDAGVAAEFEGAPFLVMELLDGIPLDAAIQKAGRLPIGIALEIMSTVAHAMSVVHGKGILHRDLKPANIFLHRPGTGALVPKVLDFGISKVTTDDSRMKPSGLTQTGHVLGSPVYMSPEQAASDKTIDARSDVHALGVVLWECLVGQAPFVSDNYNTLVVSIMVSERPRLESALPGVPATVAALVARAFAKDRNDRFPSAAELANAIDRELDRMNHARVLDGRNGAEQFFGFLGRLRSEPVPAPAQTSTTSAHAVPARSVEQLAAPPLVASPEPSSPPPGSPPGPVAAQHPKHPAVHTAAAPSRPRWLLPLAFAAASVLLVGIVGIAWRLSLSSSTDLTPGADSMPFAAPSSAPSDVGPDDLVAPTAAAASSSAAPEPSASAPPSSSASEPATTAGKTPSATATRTRATPSSTSTKTAKPPAHHGVEDDGL